MIIWPERNLWFPLWASNNSNIRSSLPTTSWPLPQQTLAVFFCKFIEQRSRESVSHSTYKVSFRLKLGGEKNVDGFLDSFAYYDRSASLACSFKFLCSYKVWLCLIVVPVQCFLEFLLTPLCNKPLNLLIEMIFKFYNLWMLTRQFPPAEAPAVHSSSSFVIHINRLEDYPIKTQKCALKCNSQIVKIT